MTSKCWNVSGVCCLDACLLIDTRSHAKTKWNVNYNEIYHFMILSISNGRKLKHTHRELFLFVFCVYIFLITADRLLKTHKIAFDIFGFMKNAKHSHVTFYILRLCIFCFNRFSFIFFFKYWISIEIENVL